MSNQKGIHKLPLEKKLEILKEAESKGIYQTSEKYNIGTSTLYEWRRGGNGRLSLREKKERLEKQKSKDKLIVDIVSNVNIILANEVSKISSFKEKVEYVKDLNERSDLFTFSVSELEDGTIRSSVGFKQENHNDLFNEVCLNVFS